MTSLVSRIKIHSFERICNTRELARGVYNLLKTSKSMATSVRSLLERVNRITSTAIAASTITKSML